MTFSHFKYCCLLLCFFRPLVHAEVEKVRISFAVDMP